MNGIGRNEGSGQKTSINCHQFIYLDANRFLSEKGAVIATLSCLSHFFRV